MKKFKVIVEREVTIDQVKDLFILACEGGSNYWAKSVSPLLDDWRKSRNVLEDNYDYMLRGFIVEEIPVYWEKYKEKKHKVTKTKIKNALRLMAKNYTNHFNDMLNENTDAETGDIFMQLCVFGDVIYG
jgi:hypothetical protein